MYKKRPIACNYLYNLQFTVFAKLTALRPALK